VVALPAERRKTLEKFETTIEKILLNSPDTCGGLKENTHQELKSESGDTGKKVN